MSLLSPPNLSEAISCLRNKTWTRPEDVPLGGFVKNLADPTGSLIIRPRPDHRVCTDSNRIGFQQYPYLEGKYQGFRGLLKRLGIRFGFSRSPTHTESLVVRTAEHLRSTLIGVNDLRLFTLHYTPEEISRFAEVWKDAFVEDRTLYRILSFDAIRNATIGFCSAQGESGELKVEEEVVWAICYRPIRVMTAVYNPSIVYDLPQAFREGKREFYFSLAPGQGSDIILESV